MWPKYSTKPATPSTEQLEPLHNCERPTVIHVIEAESSIPLQTRLNHGLREVLKFLVLVLLFTCILRIGLYCLTDRETDDFDDDFDFDEMRYPGLKDGDMIPLSVEDDLFDKEYAIPDNIGAYRERYEDYLIKYNKQYSPIEKAYRFTVFVHNVIEYEENESREPWLDLDETQFTDWTEAEMRKYLTQNGDMNLPMEGAPRFEERLYKEGELRPVSVDWRSKGKVGNVKDQKNCGSCWAFATVASVESQYAIKKNKLNSLSEQELVDCDDKNNGCNGGYRPYAMRFVQRNGLIGESVYPYKARQADECGLRRNQSDKVYIDSYQTLSTNEETIADWVAKNGPVTFGMKVTKPMYNYRGGVFEPTRQDCEERSLGSHALTIVGFGSEHGRDYWLVKNSWGTTWGMSGYFKLARGTNSCGMAEMVVAPIIN